MTDIEIAAEMRAIIAAQQSTIDAYDLMILKDLEKQIRALGGGERVEYMVKLLYATPEEVEQLQIFLGKK